MNSILNSLNFEESLTEEEIREKITRYISNVSKTAVKSNLHYATCSFITIFGNLENRVIYADSYFECEQHIKNCWDYCLKRPHYIKQDGYMYGECTIFNKE